MKGSSSPAQTLMIRFPDHSERAFDLDTTFSEVVSSYNGASLDQAVAVKANGSLFGLGQSLEEVSGNPKSLDLEVLSFDSPESKEVYRHSSSHIMAQAVKELFPESKLAIGPAIEEGFYYDFDIDHPFTPEDLGRIEKRIQKIISSNQSFKRIELSKDEAISFFSERNESLKVELIEGFPDDEKITLYQQGNFIDLCRGPHVFSTTRIKAIKLLSSSGAYWRGDERNRMLQRIYGTSFETQEALDAYIANLDEIKRRDHRRLGKELDLFSIQEQIGPGLILWHPKGAMIRSLIEDFFRDQHRRHGYDFVYTPHIALIDLWRQSGHLDFYRENMFPPMSLEGVDYQLRPMNCPFHVMIYQSHLRSYRDLPIRLAELGTVYRYERSGVLHGTMRVRGFTQDDAHIFCRADQLEAEISKVLDLTFSTLKTFGFDHYEVFVSTRPEKAVGSIENWEQATKALESALLNHDMAYKIDPGEGVFYGPKIDLKITDSLGRSWQCATLQVDFILPERFELGFIGEDSKSHTPIMIHRALMGSLERFLGILIEHYAGAFPLWLAPVQVKVIPITDKQRSYAEEIARCLSKANLRAEMDLRNEKVGLKIRDAELAKVPYMLIVGAREVENHTLSIRRRSGENLGVMELQQFIKRVHEEVQGQIPG